MLARSRRLWIGLAILVAVALLFHSALLRAVAHVLVVDDPIAGVIDLALLSSDSDELAIAARLFSEGSARRIHIVTNHPSRPEALGIVASGDEEARDALVSLGVPAAAIVTGEPSDGLEERVAALCDQTRNDPQAAFNLVAPRFASSYVRSLVNDRLPAEAASRLGVVSRPSVRYDERHWWRERLAVQHVFQGYLRRLLGALSIPERRRDPYDLDRFEATVARGERS